MLGRWRQGATSPQAGAQSGATTFREGSACSGLWDGVLQELLGQISFGDLRSHHYLQFNSD